MTYYLHRKHAYSKAAAAEPANLTVQIPPSGDAINESNGYTYSTAAVSVHASADQAPIFMAAPAVGSTSKREVKQKLPKLAALSYGKGTLAHPVISNAEKEAIAARTKEEKERHDQLAREAVADAHFIKHGRYEPKHVLLSPLRTSSKMVAESLRFDPSTQLLKLLDVHQLDTGRDWRFLNSEEWLEVRDAIANGNKWNYIDPEIFASRERCVKIWYNLAACVLLGTCQAYKSGEYPVSKKEKADAIVSSPRYHWASVANPAKTLTLKFMCTDIIRRQIHKPTISFGIPNAPPLICCPLSPLEALAGVKELCCGEDGKTPPVIVALDGEMCCLEGNMPGNNTSLNTKGRPGAHAARPLMPEQPSLRDFFLRTNAQAFVAEAERRLALASSAPLSAHLTAMEDPYVLYCNDVVFFREGAAAGYKFVENPVVFDAILYTMSPARPLTTAISWCDAPEDGFEPLVSSQDRRDNEDYVMKEDERAFFQRLTLLAESAVSESQPSVDQPTERRSSSKERKEKIKPVLPILVLGLPGCLNGKGHPLGGVSRLLHGLRERFAEQFCAIVVACGPESNQGKSVDSMVNSDFYELDDLPGVIEEANWSPHLKTLLANKSISTRWKKAVHQHNLNAQKAAAQSAAAQSAAEQRKDSKGGGTRDSGLRKLPIGLTVPKPKLQRTATGLPGGPSALAMPESSAGPEFPSTPVAGIGISISIPSKPKGPESEDSASPKSSPTSPRKNKGIKNSKAFPSTTSTGHSDPPSEPVSPRQAAMMHEHLQILMERKEQKRDSQTQLPEKKLRTQAWQELKLVKDVQRLTESLGQRLAETYGQKGTAGESNDPRQRPRK